MENIDNPKIAANDSSSASIDSSHHAVIENELKDSIKSLWWYISEEQIWIFGNFFQLIMKIQKFQSPCPRSFSRIFCISKLGI
jgi:hypothetical protein